MNHQKGKTGPTNERISDSNNLDNVTIWGNYKMSMFKIIK